MKPKILIVDDNLDALVTAKTALERYGCVVRTAGSGREAIERLRAERPDGVVLDLIMPDMNGWEVFDYMQNNETTAGVPVLVLTARGRLEDVKAGYDYGVRYYLTKPCSRRQLLRAVGVLLQRQDMIAATGGDLGALIPGECG